MILRFLREHDADCTSEGPWDSTLHFIDKHHSRLTCATTQYLLSHLEFGACLADPMGLNQRYTAVLQTEIEFANYYTASTGRTKQPPTCEEMAAVEARRYEKEARENEKLVHAQVKREEKEREKEERKAKEVEKVERRKEKEAQKAMDEEEAKELRDGETENDAQADAEEKRQAKQAAKTEKREQQVKAKVEKAERKEKTKQKMQQEIPVDQETDPRDSEAEYNHEKHELARLYREQARMDDESRRMNGTPELHSPPQSLADSKQSSCDRDTTQEQEKHESGTEPTPPAPKRERRFCILPRAHEENSWVKVPMEGVDEVGAHCGLFVPGPMYERLVGDVATRIEGWVENITSENFAEQWM